MRICLLGTADNPHVLRWARWLVARGHDLTVLCEKPRHREFAELPPCKLVHPEPALWEAALCFKVWRHKNGWYWFRARTFRAAVNRIAPDVVHGMEAFANGYTLGRMPARRYARVLTPWGNDVYHDPFQNRLSHYLVKYGLTHVDVITTNMENIGEYLVEKFGVEPQRVRPFSWGIDLETFRPGYEADVRDLRERLGIATGAPVVLSNRQVREYWGIPLIAEAARIVLAKHPTAEFVFLRGKGDPALESKLKSEMQAAGGDIARRVKWVSETIGPREMAIALNMADLFVSVPTTDMLSISVLEGMACGCVPVAADLPAYRPRLRDGENARLLKQPIAAPDLAQAILSLLGQPELKRRWAETNIALIREKDDWNRQAFRMEEVYEWARKNPRTSP